MAAPSAEAGPVSWALVTTGELTAGELELEDWSCKWGGPPEDTKDND